MTNQLLETKLYVPRRRRADVPRLRLVELLNRGVESTLTLLSAPPGFGKTTLLADWLADRAAGSSRTAWLSLDAGDSDPASFWSYVIAALQTAIPGLGAGPMAGLRESRSAPVTSVIGAVLNELAAVPDDLVLVLDDYHVIDLPEVHEGMAFLLEHLPPTLHVVIATRADPGFPLARLRARGELLEIRAGALRFTPDEAAAYLTDAMGLSLTAGDVAALEGRTEGWIAALQLAALSLQGRDDVAGFIKGFAGDDRYIVDYLVEEVLRRQPESVRRFLLDTSVLARLTGPLCDAVTGQDGGRATLEILDRENLFVVPLDDRRRWYRYHHLFADVLRARLLDEQPERIPELHRRATEWYEGSGERPEAIRHALAGRDFERAAELIELEIPGTRQNRGEAQRRLWIDALPAEEIRRRPVLSNAAAGSILIRGVTEGADAHLRDAERWLEAARESAARPPGMVVVDEEAYRDLPGAIAIHRAGLAQLTGDAAGTIVHAQRALELIRPDDVIGQGAGHALLGLAFWATADLVGASERYAAARAAFEQVGFVPDVLGSTITQADLRIAQGRLRDAAAFFAQGLELAAREAAPPRGTADMHVGLSAILREQGDLDGARRHLRSSMELGDENGLPQNPYRTLLALARIRQDEGEREEALDLVAEAARLYMGDFSPNVRPVEAVRAQMLIAAGRLPEAWAWARQRGLSASDDLGYLNEFEHIVLARLLLAHGSHDGAADMIHDAEALTARLLGGAETGGRWGAVIEIRIVQALARQALGDEVGALAALEGALELADPEGYLRVFLDEGPPMQDLLRRAAASRIAPAAVSRMLAGTPIVAPRSGAAQAMVEPLSERELEVLRLLQSELDGPDIARALFVSLNTLRTHTRNIYAKLGVGSRRAAVRRASELGLLARTPEHRPPA